MRLIYIFGRLRQPISGLSHLVGALLSIVGLVWLIQLSSETDRFWKVLSAAIFGGTMIMLYTSSTLYHLLSVSERAIQNLRRLDHTMIYVFIAGSYTPVCLVPLRQHWGWTAFGVVWGLAGLGVILKLLWLEKSRFVRIVLYLAMGWVSVFIIPKLWTILPLGVFFWLVAGGAAYTIGAAVYATKWPDPLPEVFGFHEIWHILVMVGTFCHFWFVKQVFVLQ